MNKFVSRLKRSRLGRLRWGETLLTNRQNTWIAKKMVELRESRGNKCEVCGVTEGLEFAHVKETSLKGRGRGRKERYYDIIKNPESYKLVCSNCHKEHGEDFP